MFPTLNVQVPTSNFTSSSQDGLEGLAHIFPKVDAPDELVLFSRRYHIKYLSHCNKNKPMFVLVLFELRQVVAPACIFQMSNH
jgi:hypothetical protein